MTTLSAGSATDVGRIRSSNEDSKLVATDEDLFIVADGMGGHQGGEVASGMAVGLIGEDSGAITLDGLKEAVRLANRAIFEKAGSDPDLHGMGTTLCAIRVVPGPEGDEIAWVNVGDSRIYLLRDDKLIQLSRDHSLVEDLLRDGRLTPAEAAVHPQRNILTRALGIDIDVNVDGSTVIPYLDDRYILCSDGLFNEVSEDQITSVLRRLADPGEAADELVRQAIENGGRDNITVVVVDVTDDDGRTAAASAAIAGDDATTESLDDPADGAGSGSGSDASGSGSGSDAGPGSGPAKEAEPPAPPALPLQRSSLPIATDDYAAEKDDLFVDLDHARSRRLTGRVVVFLIALVLILVVVFGSIAYSARNSYYVAFRGDVVVLYKGQPGGLLFIHPSVQQVTPLKRQALPQDLQDAVNAKKSFSSKAKADTYLQFLFSRSRDLTTTTTTVPSSTTTPTATTKPAPVATTTTVPGGP